MAPAHFTGALQPKKKSELQEIAQALNLSDSGTKDELHARIKKHLDDHQSELEDDPAFAGLFGRRKRSVQPQPAPTTRAADHLFVEPKPPSRVGRRSGGLEAIRENTPVKDLRDVSAYLKRPISPAESTPNQSPRRAETVPTPSSLPPLPPSPTKSLMENIKTADVSAIVQDIKRHDVCRAGSEFLITLRKFLSNSRNIWSLTALYELLYILYTIIPWRTMQLPLSPKSTVSLPVIYPPPSIFQTTAFWTVLLHWFIPTLLAPAVVGNLISFNPVYNQRSGDISKDAVFDPLTASIIRLALQIAYPFRSIDYESGIHGLDVLGFQLRVLNASLGLAFAVAEAISGAPSAFAQSLLRERHLLTPSRAGTPARVLRSSDA